MHLDNKGWSLNTLLICIVVLLLFLMLAIFNAYKLSSKLSSDFRNSGNVNNITDSTTSDDSTINNNDDSTNDDSTNDDDSQDNNNSAVSVPEYYKTKESQLQAATVRYLKENAITVADDEKIIIRISDVIKDKYIQSIKDDMTNNTCDAYSVVGFKDNDYVVTSYISCDSYKTQNYGVTE